MIKFPFTWLRWPTLIAGVVGFIAGLLVRASAGEIEFIFKWQTLIAGILGFTAAIVAVVIALGSEQRKAERTLRNIKQALGIEIREYAANAYRLHQRCLTFLDRGDRQTHAVEINDTAMLPVPRVYSVALAHIGDFGESGPWIMLFYNRIAAIREAGERMLMHPQADGLPIAQVANAASALIKIAELGRDLMPAIKTGIVSEDAVDVQGTADITTASKAWTERRKLYFPD